MSLPDGETAERPRRFDAARGAAIAMGMALACYPVARFGATPRSVALAGASLAALAWVAIRPGTISLLVAGVSPMAGYVAVLAEGTHSVDPLAPVVGMAWFVYLEATDAVRRRRPGPRVRRDAVVWRVAWTARAAAMGGVAAMAVMVAWLATPDLGALGTLVAAGCLVAALVLSAQLSRALTRPSRAPGDQPRA